jgi:hypothetical protein
MAPLVTIYPAVFVDSSGTSGSKRRTSPYGLTNFPVLQEQHPRDVELMLQCASAPPWMSGRKLCDAATQAENWQLLSDNMGELDHGRGLKRPAYPDSTPVQLKTRFHEIKAGLEPFLQERPWRSTYVYQDEDQVQFVDLVEQVLEGYFDLHPQEYVHFVPGKRTKSVEQWQKVSDKWAARQALASSP